MVIWIVLLLAALYFARRPFHRTVNSLTKIIHNAMRLTATSILSLEKKLSRRNHEVLMAAGHVCVAIGRNQSAKVFYERVLDIEPWNFDATEQMEKLS